MQTPEQQQQSNLLRLQAYRAKQTPEQRRRADMAERIQRYAKQLDLSMTQTSEAIRLTLSLITLGFSDDKAYATGALAVDLMDRVNRSCHVNRLRFDTLH